MLHEMQRSVMQLLMLGSRDGRCRTAIFAGTACLNFNDRQLSCLFQDEIQFAKICHTVILSHDNISLSQKITGNSSLRLPAKLSGRQLMLLAVVHSLFSATVAFQVLQVSHPVDRTGSVSQ